MGATIRKVIARLDDNNMELIFQAPPDETYQVVSGALRLGDVPGLENFLNIRVTPAAEKGASFTVVRDDMNGKQNWFWQPTGVYLAGGDEIAGGIENPTDLTPVFLEITLRAL